MANFREKLQNKWAVVSNFTQHFYFFFKHFIREWWAKLADIYVAYKAIFGIIMLLELLCDDWPHSMPSDISEVLFKQIAFKDVYKLFLSWYTF